LPPPAAEDCLEHAFCCPTMRVSPHNRLPVIKVPERPSGSNLFSNADPRRDHPDRVPAFDMA
jgi:hypothetical protein